MNEALARIKQTLPPETFKLIAEDHQEAVRKIHFLESEIEDLSHQVSSLDNKVTELQKALDEESPEMRDERDAEIDALQAQVNPTALLVFTMFFPSKGFITHVINVTDPALVRKFRTLNGLNLSQLTCPKQASVADELMLFVAQNKNQGQQPVLPPLKHPLLFIRVYVTYVTFPPDIA